MKLIIQPNDGVSPILFAIKKAKKSVDIAIFRCDRKDVVVALKNAAERGVKVTALIAHTNRGGEKNLRKLESAFLAAGVIVARTADDLIRYHDKYIIIDQQILLALSFNFTFLDIDHSRGFGIITRNGKLVQEAIKLFQADCTRSTYSPGTEAVVISPENSRKVLTTFIQRAEKQLLIYDPKITDDELVRTLKARLNAGVELRIIGKIPKQNGFDARKLGAERLHTRTIIRDGKQAFVGSQSLRPAELDSRRELGLIIHDAKIVKKLMDTFEADWAASAAKSEPAKIETKEADLAAQTPQESKELEQEVREQQSKKDAEKAVEVLVKELDPLTTSVKKVVKKAVARVGDEVLTDKQVKDTMKKVVKKAVKTAVKEAVQESERNAVAS
jgi:cardiolipin synthase A/B